MKDGQLKSNLRSTIFIVEANDYERFALWRENADDATAPLIANPVVWRQKNPGVMIELGTLDDMPVTLSLTWATINNCSVMFWYMPSVVTDSRMAEKWLDENCNPPTWSSGYPARCNAMNFHHCLQAIEEYRERCMKIIDEQHSGSASASAPSHNSESRSPASNPSSPSSAGPRP